MTPLSATATFLPPPVPRPGSGAYLRLQTLIVRGRLAPGARVSEAEIAARLGVSRTPAREAMRRLLAEGLLVPDGGGARPRLAVAPIGATDAAELYSAAAALEGISARCVGAMGGRERRARADALRRCERRFREAARSRPVDYDALFERHDAFHRTLAAACAGARTRAMLDTIRPLLDRYEWLYAPLMGTRFGDTYREHAAVIRTVRDGDGRACERAVRANWLNGGRRLVQALEERGDAAARTVALQVVRLGRAT